MTIIQQPTKIDGVKQRSRRSSTQTESTTSDSSGESPVPMDSKKDRRKRGSSKKSRDILGGLIAKEMVSAWQDEEDMISEELATPSKSSAEFFYAQMNGEAIDTVQSGSGHKKETVDHCSSGLNLTDDDDINSTSKSRNSRSSLGSTSKTLQSSSQGDDEAMSIEEIQRFVMETIPQEVKDKIPKEAWGEIFGEARADLAKNSCNVTTTKEEDQVVESDDSSDMSDITEHTGVVKGAHRKAKRAPLNPEEEKQMYDICPSLLPGSFHDSPSIASRDSGRLSVDRGVSIQRTKKSGVSFNTVQVRYYERILDINPAVTSGVAIGIGWRYKKGGKLTVDEWESQRGGVRSNNDLVLPRHVREGMLKDLGYQQKDIADATRMILKAKNLRKITVQNLGAQSMEEAVESASRRIKGILSFGKKEGLIKT